jgi:hypothetical protein
VQAALWVCRMSPEASAKSLRVSEEIFHFVFVDNHLLVSVFARHRVFYGFHHFDMVFAGACVCGTLRYTGVFRDFFCHGISNLSGEYYLISRCTVYFRMMGLYFFNSMRSGVFLRFFWVMWRDVPGKPLFLCSVHSKMTWMRLPLPFFAMMLLFYFSTPDKAGNRSFTGEGEGNESTLRRGVVGDFAFLFQFLDVLVNAQFRNGADGI